MSDPFVSAYTQIEGELELDKWFEMGGKGSGHHGHKGVKGRRGGSAPSRGGGLAKLSAPVGDAGISGNQGISDWMDENTWRGWEQAGDTNRAELKAQVAQNLSDASGVTPQEASDFVQQWAHSSNDNDMRSLALQQDAAKEFGLKTSEFTQSKIDKVNMDKRELLPKMREKLEEQVSDQEIKEASWQLTKAPYEPLMESDKQRALMRSMYNETQAELKARGIMEVRLYRGVKLDREPDPEWGKLSGIDPEEIDFMGWGALGGATIPISTNTLESWSVGKSVADGFAKGETGVGVTFEAVIPAERILSMPATGFGCLTEGEVVTLGGIEGDTARVASIFE